MTIMSSLYAGVTGLQANGNALSVIGDNISNVNTVGFKGSRCVFGDILASSLGGAGGSSQVGRGVRLSAVEQIFTQGTFQTTGNSTDMAIDGNGFFKVSSTEGTYYTRAGQFSLNSTYQLVNPDGFVMQGFAIDATSGAVSGTTSNVVLDSSTSASSASTSVTIAANLDAGASVPGTAWSVADREDASNFSTAVTVYDSLGGSHSVTTYYRKTGANAWDWYAVADVGGTMTQGYNGSLDFGTDGTLETVGSPTETHFAWTGADASALTFDFGTSTDDSGTGLDGVTQYDGTSQVKSQSQNGYGEGTMKSIGINPDGKITSLYDNGQTKDLYYICLTDFPNIGGLSKKGGNLFASSGLSGDPVDARPKLSGRGQVLSSSLELSSVDIAEEFVNLITTQRGFQANSRTITTTDEMVAEILSMR